MTIVAAASCLYLAAYVAARIVPLGDVDLRLQADKIYGLPGFVAGCVALRAGPSTDRAMRHEKGLRSRVGLIVPYAVVVLGVVAIIEAVRGGASLVMVVAVTAVGLLVAARQILPLRQNEAMLREATAGRRALLESESTLRATLEATADGIAVVDGEGAPLHLNRRFLDIWDVPRELLETSDTAALHAYLSAQMADPSKFITAANAIGVEAAELADTIQLRDGRSLERFLRPLVVGGKQTGHVLSLRDISERAQSERELHRSEERFRTLVQAAGSVIIAMATDGRILEFNGAAEVMFGVSREDALGRDAIGLLVQEERRDEFRALFKAVLAGNDLVAAEIQTPDARGVPHTAHWNVTCWLDVEGKPAGVIAAGIDISERKRAEEQLRSTLEELSRSKEQLDQKSRQLEYALATERERGRLDPLTGTLNHGAISDMLAARLTDAHSDAAAFALVMVDVDGMKAVNDTYGHQAGDCVLLAVAGALSRSGAVVGRYGGDEFVAMLDGADRAAARRYCDAVEDELESVVLTDAGTGHHIAANVSLGIAVYPDEAENVADLIRLSDSAMYAYKRERHRPASDDGAGVGHVGDDRSAKLVGELVPLLTAPGALDDKLRLVSHRLSIGAGYAGVSFTLFAPKPGVPLAANSFAPGADDVVERWNRHQREDDSPERHPVRQILEETLRPVIIEDVSVDQRLMPEERSLLVSAGLRRALVVPMIWQESVVGMLGVASKGAPFDARDIQFVSAVATQVTAIVTMHHLVTDLEAATARLAASQGDTVMMLAAAAEANDRTTGLHLASIRVLAEALGRELGYADREVAGLGMAAVLHDIGKISVPDAVLSSTGRLDAEQWEIMRRHTVWGAQFLAGKPGFRLAAQVARSHHERWDGRGYPDGIEGDEIPEAAQIVTVADSFDAMTHDRPYRLRRPVTEAIGEIIACSGKQFSPRVVAALVRLYERDELPRASHEDRDAAESSKDDDVEKAAA
jgi:diguanylate cyclase (GGDEF)-like protein/PAS domain S-box-containing protein